MMADVYYEGYQANIPFYENATIKEIFNKFLAKINKQTNQIYFLYNGKIINGSEIINDVMNKDDRERKKLSIIIKDILEKELIKHSNALCQCGSPCFLEFDNYKISLRCQKGHFTNNILIREYKELQEIETSKIVCEICHMKNKSNVKNGEFYKCVKCRLNICPSCKEDHLRNSSRRHRKAIFGYDEHIFRCPYHLKEFNSYCPNCKKDLCLKCRKNHRCKRCNEVAIKYDTIFEKKENLEEQKNRLDKLINLFREQINEIIKYLNEVADYLKNYIDINAELLNIYNSPKLNYQMVQNIESINFEKAINDLTKINEEENLVNKFSHIMNIHHEMNYINDLTCIYKINENNDEMRILSKDFIDINQDICNIEVDGKTME